MLSTMLRTPSNLSLLREQVNALIPRRALVARRPDRLDCRDVGLRNGNIEEIA